MRSLQGTAEGIGGLQPRSFPSICNANCNNVFLEAQRVGKTPELCAPNSIFRQYYAICAECLEDNGTDRNSQNLLNELIEYCFEVQGMVSPSLVENTVTVLSTITVGGVKTVSPFEKTVTFLGSVLETAVVTTETSQDGHHTVRTFTTTYTHLLSDGLISTLQNTSLSTPRMSEVTASNPTATTKSEGKQSNRAWVAGPAIGGIIGIAILVLVSWLLLRVKRNRDSKQKGHELHGESALKSELEVKLHPQELEAKPPEPQELDAPENTKQRVELPDNNS
ncbi:hypothetical protein F4803DRAFT_541931 [Xylaria telfairii]|nr:hypothetical protein F4803DRAFT_541931 [Xylaria telfairii]